MSAYSLRQRMILGAAVLIFVTLVLAGLGIVWSFSASLESDRRSDLEDGLDHIIARINPDDPVPVRRSALADPRYDIPSSGVYWQIDDLTTGSRLRSRSLMDTELELRQTTQSAESRVVEAAGPGGQRLIALTREVTLEWRTDPHRFRVSVAEVRDVNDPLEAFAASLGISLGAVALVQLLAATLLVRFGLEPLAQLQAGIEAIRRGQTDRLPEGFPREVTRVVKAVNDLLSAQEATVAFARERAADLAHGLKTPLAALGTMIDRLRASGDEANAGSLAMLTDGMSERVEYQMRLAQLRFRGGTKGEMASLNTAILRSVAVLQRTHRGEALNWSVEADETLEVDMDEQDLLELVGVLLENACKWARQKVMVSAADAGRFARISIDDDGDGLSDAEIAELGPRGKRLDESRPGNGLGLAIVFDIVKLNGGKVRLERGRMGGLGVRVELPLHAPVEAR